MVSANGPYRSAQEVHHIGVVGRATTLAKGFALDVFSPRVAAAKLLIEVPNLDPMQRSTAIVRVLKSGTIDDCFALFSKNLSSELQILASKVLVEKITKRFEFLTFDATTSESGAAGYFGLQSADRFFSDHKAKVKTLIESGTVTSSEAQKILSDFASSK